jgi:hypothetical protein
MLFNLTIKGNRIMTSDIESESKYAWFLDSTKLIALMQSIIR